MTASKRQFPRRANFSVQALQRALRDRDELHDLWIWTRDVFRPKTAVAHRWPDELPPGCPRHVVLIHGHNCLPEFLDGLCATLRAVPGAENWRFWFAEYDTHWKPFSRSAAEIAKALRASGENFEDVIVVGHSLGGVVARQMVADGFPCRALFALGSPHQGFVPWWPFAEAGTLSMHSISRRLHMLNRNPRDIAARRKYHFLAAGFRDPLGEHNHDTLVSLDSALGSTLGSVAARWELHFSYNFPQIIEPHVDILRRKNLGALLERFGELLRD